jgi:hypothetical protein
MSSIKNCISLLTVFSTISLFSISPIVASDTTVPADCPYPTWKAACQRYCLCQGYTVQANRCYAKDQCTLVCRCSDKSFSDELRAKFAASYKLTAAKCPAENPDEFPKLDPTVASPTTCDTDCRNKCSRYLTKIIADRNLTIIPDNGDDPTLEVHAKQANGKSKPSATPSAATAENSTDTAENATELSINATADQESDAQTLHQYAFGIVVIGASAALIAAQTEL